MGSISFLMVVSPSDDFIKLKRSLKSIIKQTEFFEQVIIVKNGKLSEKIDLELFLFKNECPTRITFVILNATKNLGPALNDGFGENTSDWILRLDPDDVALRNRVRDAKIRIRENKFDLAFFSCYEIGLDKGIIYKKLLNEIPSKIQLFFKNPFTHSTALIKSSALRDLGGYRDIYLAEDYDLWIRFYLGNRVTRIFSDFVTVLDCEGVFSRRKSTQTIRGELGLFLLRQNFGYPLKLLNITVTTLRVIYRLIPIGLARPIYFRYILGGKHELDFAEAKNLFKVIQT